MNSKYIYCKQDKNLRCRIFRYSFLNGVKIELQVQKKWILFNYWMKDGLVTEMAFSNDTKVEEKENALTSAIEELFQLRIKVKNLYDKL